MVKGWARGGKRAQGARQKWAGTICETVGGHLEDS